ncbi:hypothetical protein MMC07_006189 [Pseudocyphellaria aurata]|nr:hypothetical protein [Pseudocyphellaria aurata]
MAKLTFSSLPVEVHVRIAEQCETNDLVNLCRASKGMKERCTRVLYRHVDLNLRVPNRDLASHNLLENSAPTRALEKFRAKEGVLKEWMFACTLKPWPECAKYFRSYKEHLPECAKYVRSYKGQLRDSFSVLGFREEARLWNALKTLTHVRHVEVDFRHHDTLNNDQIPHGLFPSATSLALIGYLEFLHADQSFLYVADPAMLTRLCFTMIHYHDLEVYGRHANPSLDRQQFMYGRVPGLLSSLTGKCSSLRSLTLRRKHQNNNTEAWWLAAEDLSYKECASFLTSIQSTLEEFTFEQTPRWPIGADQKPDFELSRTSDTRFRRIILPVLLRAARTWPRITAITLHGVRTPDGEPDIEGELGVAVLGTNIKLEVQERGVLRQEGGDMVEVFEN